MGTTSVMRDDDYLIGTYRTHGHALARGTSPNRVMAEIFGRVDGTSGGRGGSMHIFDAETRFMGGYGIVGGNLPLAAGIGLASQYRDEDSVTVCMFGDGASNTGNFGETMNLAALWSLPVVFLVENNLYGMGTAGSPPISISPARRAGPLWSRRSPTGTTATRLPTPRSTVKRMRSNSGAKRTRSPAFPGSASTPGC